MPQKDTTKRAPRILYFSGRLDLAMPFLIDTNVFTALNFVYYQTTVNFRL